MLLQQCLVEFHPFMPISLLLDKEIGERKRAKGLVSEIHRLSPWNPFATAAFEAALALLASKIRNMKDEPVAGAENMDDEKKMKIIEMAGKVKSKKEMHELVQNIAINNL